MNWKETETSWIDLNTGLEWDKEFKTNVTHYEAEEWAKSQGKRLATRDDFIEAEKNGIRKLENIKWNGYWFWSSTPYPGYDGKYAYVFNGYSGYADDVYTRSYSVYNVAARAVSNHQKNEILIHDCVDSKLEPTISFGLSKADIALEKAWEINR